MKKLFLALVFTGFTFGAVASVNVNKKSSIGHYVPSDGLVEVKGQPGLLVRKASASPLMAEAERHTMTVKIDIPEDNPKGWKPNFIAVYNDEETLNYYLMGTETEVPIEIPAGTYDILVRYIDMTWMHYCYDIHELVNAEDSAEIATSPVNAKNKILYKPVTMEGTPMTVTECLDWATMEPTSIGTMQSIGFAWEAQVEGIGYVTGSVGSYAAPSYYPFEDSMCLQISDVSDRYTFLFNVTGVNADFSLSYAAKAKQIGCSDNSVITNQPSDYKKIEFEFVLPENINPEWPKLSTLDIYNTRNGKMPSGWLGSWIAVDDTRTTNIPVMADISMAGDETGINLEELVIPGLGHAVILDETGSMRVADVKVAPVSYEGSANTFNWLSTGLYRMIDTSETEMSLPRLAKFYPALANFSWNEDQTELLPGQTAPCFVSYTSPYSLTSATGGFEFDFEYWGQVADHRDLDKETAKISVTYGGEKTEVTDYSSLTQWVKTYFNPYSNPDIQLKEGVYEFNNTFTLPGGSVKGNVATLNVDYTGEDFCAPTLRFVQYRNSDNKVTDKYTEGEEIIVNLAAGDWVRKIGNSTLYYNCDPVTVTVWVAPSNSEEWTEISLSELTDEASVNFGYVYTGKMKLDTAGQYDVRIKVEDEAGNTQEQRIINALTVTPGSGVANIHASDEYTEEIYNLQGLKVAKSNILPGIYMIKLADGSFRKVMIK